MSAEPSHNPNIITDAQDGRPQPEPRTRGRFAFAPAGLRRRIGFEIDRAALWFGASITRDVERGLGFSWLVVGLAAGAAAYLALPAEPWLVALAVVSMALVVSTIWARERGARAFALALAAAVMAGMLAAKIEALMADAPRLDRERLLTVTGWVEEAERGLGGSLRLIVRVKTMTARGGLPDDAIPRRIAVSVAGQRGAAAEIGAGVTFLARLKPPDGPTMPGSYDFARRAYFEGRGGSGFVLGSIAKAEIGPAPGLIGLTGWIAAARLDLAERIRATIPGASGAIAAALIVGEARAIPEAENEAMRVAGLSHIISISGLHMTLIGGSVFWAVRLLLALMPGFALRFSIKKWSAIAAFGAITFYLLMSGGGVATNRSYIMFSVALLAVLCDRPAISQRTIAVSAAIVIFLSPHAVAEPSFLMSFLAVLALVAAYEAWRERPRDPVALSIATDAGLIERGWRAASGYVMGSALSSVVAGLATAPIIAAEFHRGAPYGLIANMAVLPVVGIVIMPAALVSMLLLPFGLDALALTVMGWGIDYMTWIARAVADWPGGEGLIGRIHPASEGLAIAGILWLALWREALRLLGLVPLAAALALAPFATKPDVMIGPGGTPVAVRAADGRLAILDAKRARFTVDTWLAADADPREPTDPTLGGGWQCDPHGCAIRLDRATGPPDWIAVVRNPLAFEEDCRIARLVITTLAAPPGCARFSTVMDQAVLARSGALSLTLPENSNKEPTRIAAYPANARPWTPRSEPPNGSGKVASTPETSRTSSSTAAIPASTAAESRISAEDRTKEHSKSLNTPAASQSGSSPTEARHQPPSEFARAGPRRIEPPVSEPISAKVRSNAPPVSSLSAQWRTDEPPTTDAKDEPAAETNEP